MYQNSLNNVIKKFEKNKVVDEIIIDDCIDDLIVFVEPESGKKIAQTYICDKCNRKKTIRFKSVPTPAQCGKCPRCKEGTMYSEFITVNARKKHAL